MVSENGGDTKFGNKVASGRQGKRFHKRPFYPFQTAISQLKYKSGGNTEIEKLPRCFLLSKASSNTTDG
ncbi:MAG: hypothetical protein CMM01_25975 [Rhodopirellula sp.]|nr:hypothetical protein [Rhodopirellula sp.]OUX49126.1 MAG: hypothetical protein CBE43_11040 [Rhodopirellula sp. TMED283]